MDIKVNHKMIKELCGPVSYKRGESFYRSNKVKIHKYQSTICEAVVSGVEEFHVVITKDATDSLQTTCSCPALASFQKTCQHTAAVLLVIHQLQRQGMSSTEGNQSRTTSDGKLTEGFLTLFREPVQRSGRQLHFENRETLDVQFTCKPFPVDNGQHLLGMSLTVGDQKVGEIREFLQHIKDGSACRVSSEFTYDPAWHCFLIESDAILHQLIDAMEDEKAFLEFVPAAFDYATINQTLFIPPSLWLKFVPLFIKASHLKVEHSGYLFENIQITTGTPPLQFVFEEAMENNYRLTIEGFEQVIVLNFYHAVLCGGELFLLEAEDCERLYELKQMHLSPDTDYIPIPVEQIDFFMEKVVPGLKKIGNVRLSKALSQTFLKTPLMAKLYLDRLKNRLLAGLEFHYGNIVIQPLENRDTPVGPMVIRDLEKEEEILQLMEESQFSKTDGGYFMQNEALEYEFLYHIVPELQQKVQLYATTAVRNRIARKNPPPKIRISARKQGQADWLEFKFEMDGIPDKQIKEVLIALEEKRKYYRLRNGALLSLETKEMQEIHHFLHLAANQKEDFETTLNLPVTQSLSLLDALHENQIFTAEGSFRQLLDHLADPGSLDVEVPKQLESVLRDYQTHGFKWMKTLAGYKLGGVLADDMGLGKTLQSIAFILSEITSIRASKLPVIIVCPSSVTYNWLDEIVKFAPEVEAIVIDGPKKNREELYQAFGDIDCIITSYPILRQDLPWFESKTFHTVFFDEAQAFKNPVTQTARAVKKIQADNRFALTGTPVENSLEELWSIFHVVYPQLFQGLREYSFLSKKTIARRVQPFLLRRMKKDVLAELPGKNESLHTVELLPAQKKIYAAYLAKLRHDTLKHLDKDTVRKNRIKILAGLTRLRQICCHPALFAEGYKEGSAKFEKLLQILEESRLSGRRVLIFSQFTKMLKLIGREMEMRGQSYFYLDGQTPSETRVEFCNRFNDGEKNLFLVSLKAGGTGLNLTGADTVILYDLWWNPAVEEQAADRAHRIGQKKEVEVIKLVARGTIEEKMNQLQERKRHLIAEIIDPEKHASAMLTEEDIREILMI